MNRKFGRTATFSASLLTLIAISCGSLGLWRVGTDLEWAGDFFVQEGFLSHWQVWIGAAVGVQYSSWWLARYAGIVRRREAEIAASARFSGRHAITGATDLPRSDDRGRSTPLLIEAALAESHQ
jgi:hypothetical protein